MEGLRFCQLWAKEDITLTPTEVTKRILAGSMEGVENFLTFTFETREDFGGWLPTLDTCLRIEEDNTISYNYWEKDTCSKMTVQQKSAINENTKYKLYPKTW